MSSFFVLRRRMKIPEDVIIWIIRSPFHWDSGNHIYQAIPERPIDYRSMPQKAKAQTHFDFYISQKNAPKLIQRKKNSAAHFFFKQIRGKESRHSESEKTQSTVQAKLYQNKFMLKYKGCWFGRKPITCFKNIAQPNSFCLTGCGTFF